MNELNAGEVVLEGRAPSWLIAVAALAMAASVAALLWAYSLGNRLAAAEAQLKTDQQDRIALEIRLHQTDARLRANADALGNQVSATQRQQAALSSRSQQLLAQQKEQAAALETQTAATEEKIGTVSNQLSSVKTDVGAVKNDVTSTRSDLADTRKLLQRTIGDAGVMSGLIARNHDELEVLKHRGDRSYYEFTLRKNAQPTLLDSVKLQLKKTNEKKNRFSLLVSADDRNIEKKDKTIDEPVQFYTGKNPVLYELVVNNVGHDVVSGYLSVPKGQ